MKHDLSISEAAKMAGMTSETLRHYDRIGLVKPSRTDPWTGYRYYTEQEVIRLNTIQALQCMDLSLKEIKNCLEYDNLEQIVSFLKQAEKNANEKIKRLQYAKAKIRTARMDYEKKLRGKEEKAETAAVRQLPRRVIMLSDTLRHPTVDNLWSYHRHFYARLTDVQKPQFVFEDMAGVFTQGGRSRMFAVCRQYTDTAELTVLPEGPYLCADCPEDSRETVLSRLSREAEARFGTAPDFAVQLIVITGILQWDYQIQVPVFATGRAGIFLPDRL